MTTQVYHGMYLLSYVVMPTTMLNAMQPASVVKRWTGNCPLTSLSMHGVCVLWNSLILPGFVIIIGRCRVMAVVNFSIVTVLMTIHQVYNRRQSDHQVTVL